jgi:hypothetical protein
LVPHDTVSGDGGALATFRAILRFFGVQVESPVSVSVSGLRSADLDHVLSLVEWEGLTANQTRQLEGQGWCKAFLTGSVHGSRS